MKILSIGVCLLFLANAPALLAEETPAMPLVIDVSPDQPGRVFEGIGALSAGASSRLLIDYPEPARSEILDFLFRPNFGASLHQLKVEIGGEVNSTCGTEPAHARTREEFLNPKSEYYQRGYEWWLMKEAKRRNPSIALDVLQWGAPPWIGAEEIKHIDPARASQGARDFTTAPDAKQVVRKQLGEREFRFFSQDNASFVAAFIQGAKQNHGLDINFCGIWNEVTYESAWIKQLRRTLDEKGLQSVKIVAADLYTNNKWDISKDILADPELAHAVHAIGAHYVKFQSSPEAIATGKPLYASEDLSVKGDWESAKKFARTFNRNYIQGKITKTIFWSLIDSYYGYLDFPGCGPMRANTPWSGNYDVQPAIWATAHTTQFIQPGWRYLDGACAVTAADISHATLLAPNKTDFSIIIESCLAKSAQRLTFRLDQSLSSKPLAIWRTTKDRQFERLADLPQKDGSVTLEVAPGSIYSLTTTSGQRKGAASPLPATAFPFPYADDFETGRLGRQPKYFADQEGSFEIAASPDGKGRCLFQAVTQKGIPWLRSFLQPYSLIGEADCKDYEVSCRSQIVGSGSVAIGGRIRSSKADFVPGYWLKIHSDQCWTLTAYELVESAVDGKKQTRQIQRVLAEGKVPFSANEWHSLAMRFQGDSITALVDGRELAVVGDGTFSKGASGIMSGWNQAYFDDFAMKPITASQESRPIPIR